ncbi:TPA: hypothetical protein N0F65_012165 [Lagenidium giganteum]|uniref:GST N-terminal domain-containing protein n=1 Tax=Lagenidium giganteum TaxID=4803 RepID=A0AAV2YXJ2_9STRA|nr:TPA: hypothetical protein N0F65_012165 [Lagenidium giganteum]
MKAMPPALLVSIPASNYVEKARWALQLAEIPFEEEKHIALLAYRSTMPKGGKSVPLLKTSSFVLTDSSDILQYCAQKLPSLYPNDEAKKLELYYDTELGPHLRRFTYYMVFKDTAAAKRVLLQPLDSWFEFLLAWLLFPLIKFLICQGMLIDEENAMKSWAKAVTVLEEQEAKLGDGPVGSQYLAGPTFSAADISFCAHMSLIVHPPEHKYISPYVTDDNIPPELRERVHKLRQSKLGQYVSWGYENHRPDMMVTIPKK